MQRTTAITHTPFYESSMAIKPLIIVKAQTT